MNLASPYDHWSEACILLSVVLLISFNIHFQILLVWPASSSPWASRNAASIFRASA
jgi:hypothetical protein